MVSSAYQLLLEQLGGVESIRRNRRRSLEAQKAVELSQKWEMEGVEPWQQDPIYLSQTFGVLKAYGDRIKDRFDEVLSLEVSKINSDCSTALTTLQEDDQSTPLAILLVDTKGAERGKKKVAVKYGGDMSQLSDIVRGTVVVSGNVDELYKVLMKFIHSPRFQKRSVHFTHIADRFQNPLGDYRDILTLVRIDGYICELQFNLREFVVVKESREGHGLYERTRLVNDDLLLATMQNNLDDALLALEKGASPLVREGQNGLSPLDFAAFHGSLPMINALLDAQADPHAMDDHGLLPLHRAIENGHTSASELIISHMNPQELLSNLNEESGPPLIRAAEMATEMGQRDIATFLNPIVKGALQSDVEEVRVAAAHCLSSPTGIELHVAWLRKALFSPWQRRRGTCQRMLEEPAKIAAAA